MKRDFRSVNGGWIAHQRRGLTLVELIVAAVVAALLITAASAAIGRVIDVRARARDIEEATAAAQMAARMIARDLEQLVRDPDPRQNLLRITDDRPNGQQQQERDELIMITRGTRPVRSGEDSPDAGVYEVQYRIEADTDYASVLWRRADMMPDEELRGGGVAVPLAVRVVSLRFEAFDGLNWQEEWDSDEWGLPFAVRVTCTAQRASGRGDATARMTVAIDRVPKLMTEQEMTAFDSAMTLRGTDGFETFELDLFGGSTSGFFFPSPDASGGEDEE